MRQAFFSIQDSEALKNCIFEAGNLLVSKEAAFGPFCQMPFLVHTHTHTHTHIGASHLADETKGSCLVTNGSSLGRTAVLTIASKADHKN